MECRESVAVEERIGLARSGARRALSLFFIYLGVLIVVVDGSIVIVAAPSMLEDLHLADASITWVINSYTLAFCGCLLLGGRLSDFYGLRRVFVLGAAAFGAASLVCAITHSMAILLSARALQGIAGAVVTAASLSLIVSLTPDPIERSNAMGWYAFMTAAGGALGELLGGVLTSAFGWRWIFLVNVPICFAICTIGPLLLPPDSVQRRDKVFSWGTGIVLAAAIFFLTYAVLGIEHQGRFPVRALLSSAAAVGLMILFIFFERRSRSPMIPIELLRTRSIVTANLVQFLSAAGASAWFVMSTLYMQRILNYDPLSVGLAYLPAELLFAVCSLGLAARSARAFGARLTISLGVGLTTCGLVLFGRAPLSGDFVFDVLPGMMLMGLGAGMTAGPLLLMATTRAGDSEPGVASGLFNTSFMLGGALGVAISAAVAQSRTRHLLASAVDPHVALNSGYHFGFLSGAVLAVAAVALCWVGLRRGGARWPQR